MSWKDYLVLLAILVLLRVVFSMLFGDGSHGTKIGYEEITVALFSSAAIVGLVWYVFASR
jgi:hypothetical protein